MRKTTTASLRKTYYHDALRLRVTSENVIERALRKHNVIPFVTRPSRLFVTRERILLPGRCSFR